jgi:hypothetical protein
MGIRTFSIATLALAAAYAAPAHADSRDIQAAVDGYLAGQRADAALVGGPGSAGYDSGFWIRGGDFSLKINLTLQARYEAFDWDAGEPGVTAVGRNQTRGGDLSGFSLPRALVKLSGTAPCSTSYYVELDFGHFGSDLYRPDLQAGPSGRVPGPENGNDEGLGGTLYIPGQGGSDTQSRNYENTREAWIQWSGGQGFNVRMGQILTPNTRQLMTAPELQQFVDISLASAFTGHLMSGYTDRNRDHGLMVHGAFGCAGELSYMVALTNGEGGDSMRNVVDNRTSDNPALSARVNWAFLKPIYYEESALRQTTCEWYGEVGAWGYSYAVRRDGPHDGGVDNLFFGLDLALGYGGFSFTAAATLGMQENPIGPEEVETLALLVQLGYLFPGTAWEIAARYSSVEVDASNFAGEGTLTEIAGALNYYLNGHSNKLSLDVSFLDESDDDIGFFDVYTGIQPLPGDEDSAILIRFQWQLAL